jgi:hypothetical protein
MFGAINSSGAISTDPQFNYVVTLLNGNGTNGAQNNTFVDSSTLNTAITRFGNTTQGSITPYSNAWSNYFPSAYFTSAALAANQLTADFTIEFWVYPLSVGTQQGLVTITNTTSSGNNGLSVYLDTSNKLTFFVNGNTVVTSTTTNIISANSWYHIALVRNSTTNTLYLNGVSVASSILTPTWPATPTIGIGRLYNDNTSFTLSGYLSNVRIVKGTAVYTANFTPPTAPLTAITNTYLLNCQSNRFIDNSSSALTFTTSGSPSVQRFSPFSSTPYAASNNSGSAYFDGNGDYLTLPTKTGFGFGTGDFTVEFWLYPLSTVNQYFIDIRTTGTSRVLIYYNSGALSFASEPPGIITITGTSITLYAWQHIALSKVSGSTRLFLNGTQVGSTYTTSQNYNTTNEMIIGRDTGATSYVSGYMSDVRVIKGTGLYSANFTPPTTPLTAITNTTFLLSSTNAGIYDNSMMNDFETVGNAQVSTSVKKYGSGSMSFDGTGDYLQSVSFINQQLGTGNFTIEGWVYLNVISGISQYIVSRGPDASNGWAVLIDGGSRLSFNYTASFLSGTTSLVASTWYHFAVVRSGTATGNVKLYLNGVLNATSAGAINDNFNQSSFMYVGLSRSLANALNGYVDDLRITKSIARYTANFTPPTQPYPIS